MILKDFSHFQQLIQPPERTIAVSVEDVRFSDPDAEITVNADDNYAEYRSTVVDICNAFGMPVTSTEDELATRLPLQLTITVQGNQIMNLLT